MRSSIEESQGGLRIVIPARRNWFILLFLAVWLVGWAFGELSAIGVLFDVGPMRTGRRSAPSAFLAFWLLGWTFGGAAAAYTWLWNLCGREIVRIDGAALAISREPIPFPRSREFDWTQVRNLRVSPSLRPRQNFSPGTIAFDYGARTHGFGRGLDEAEAQMLIDAIARRFPQPASETR